MILSWRAIGIIPVGARHLLKTILYYVYGLFEPENKHQRVITVLSLQAFDFGGIL